MPEQKNKRSSQRHLASPPNTPPKNVSSKFKFNISHDNLRPFVNSTPSPRTPPRRPKYLQIRNQRQLKFAIAKSETKSEKQQNDQNVRKVMHSPDVLRQASNVILKAIELKGIGCVWDQVQESKSECMEEQQWEGRQVWTEPPQAEKNQSSASTNDQYSTYYPQIYQQTYAMYELQRRYYDPNYFVIDINSIESDQRTTLMIKNIPNKYTIQYLAEEIDREHANCYDFLYLPCDIKNNCNVGYGFINFVNTDVLRFFYQRFQNKRWGKFKSQKICNLTYARLQGLSSLIDHFQNSKVLNNKDKKYQPIIREMSSIDSLIQLQKATSPALGQ